MCSIDRIAKFPTAKGAAALGSVAGQARLALAAGRDCPQQHTLPHLVTRHPWTKLMNHPYGFMADRQAGLDRVFALDDVDIGAANGGEANLDNGLTVTGLGNRLLLQAEHSGCPKDIRFHHASCRRFDLSFLNCHRHRRLPCRNSQCMGASKLPDN